MSMGWGHCDEAQLIEDHAGSDVEAVLALEPGEVAVVSDLAGIYGPPAGMARLGERMTDHWSSPRVTAVAALAKTLEGTKPRGGEVRAGCTCSEADAIALVLALHGHHTAAAQVICRHADDDHDSGQHADIAARISHQPQTTARDDGAQPEATGSARDLAADYVRQLVLHHKS